MSPHDYIRDGAQIYRRSFAIIRAETDLTRFTPLEERVVVRMIHSCGQTDLVEDIDLAPGAVAAGVAALAGGAPILCDTTMVASGVTRARLPAGNDVVCTLPDERVSPLAAELGTTRTAAAVELWGERIDGAVIAIGNAPTALFHLLDLLTRTPQRPAAIVGMPVGFVGAAESKDALAAARLPHLVVRGRRGGSAIACGALNALASDSE